LEVEERGNKSVCPRTKTAVCLGGGGAGVDPGNNEKSIIKLSER